MGLECHVSYDCESTFGGRDATGEGDVTVLIETGNWDKC